MGKDTIASCKISRRWYNPVCEVMKMAYDNALVAGKLRRWEKYLDDFRLPRWEEIPNLGLYMEQVTVLEANGFDTIRASLGREAVTLISSHCPDLVLLDLSLPDMDGMEILAGLRKWSTLPVIVVSARGRERDKVIALDMGADDYLTKPFGPGELLARIRAALRHVRTAAGGEVGRTGVYRCGDLEVDCVRRRVRINGEDIHLTQSEYRILSLLTRHAGKVLTYDFILRELWGPSAGGSNQILRVNVANIRRKIEKNPAEPKYIFTEIGVGYRMTDADAPDEPEQ